MVFGIECFLLVKMYFKNSLRMYVASGNEYLRICDQCQIHEKCIGNDVFKVFENDVLTELCNNNIKYRS